MGTDIIIIGLLVVLLLLLASGFWVGLTLGAVGLAGLFLLGGESAASLTGTALWSSINSWPLTAMPLFLFMGEILFRARLADDMFQGLTPWMNRIPGRLLHANIVGCGILAAIVGSSGVCAATVGRMSLPELRRQGYDETLMIGTLSGSGTLGLLIPPSIMMIVYGVAGQVSIARLFIAGLIPGLIIMALFMAYVMFWALRHPEKVPAAPENLKFLEKIRRSSRLIPTILLIIAVIGSIYGGYATPTEAAVLGVVGSLLLAAINGTLDRGTFVNSVIGGVRTTVLIMMILAGASVLSALMDYSGLPHKLAAAVTAMELSTGMLLFGLAILYLILGCFLDGVSMIVATTAVVLPMISAAGVDLVWFGIYLIVLIELAQLTPPIGFNLYILQAMTGKDLMFVARASLPFFMLLLLTLLILSIWPNAVLFLPEMLVAR
ncbi:TRAP transporter large permease [Oceanibium sediminis]|uniref:TRAP transporter large permease n=1 Tax=Oceanibium sediminis TaxID=2026339 RepID=UPI000DD2BC4D|nr:TRAP transporter large permease subunit [Oceanibium sediminis]